VIRALHEYLAALETGQRQERQEFLGRHVEIAEPLADCRRVALKVLPFAAALDPKQLQRFQNEARAAAQLPARG
jgi:hypothetical protein